MRNKLVWGLFVFAGLVGVGAIFFKNFRGPSAYNIGEQIEIFKVQGVPDFNLPIIALKSGDRKNIVLNELKAPVIFVNYWASWCAPCIHEIPSLLKLGVKYQNLIILAISIEESADTAKKFLEPFVESVPDNFIVLHDAGAQVAHKYGTVKIPETFIINKDKKLIVKVVDAQDWMGAEFLKFIDPFLKVAP